MFRTDKVFILPIDGIEEGEDVQRTEPRTGYFIVKFGKNHLERGLSVFCCKGKWEVKLDGFNVAPPSESWQSAFGQIYNNAQKSGGIFLGRAVGVVDFLRILNARSKDKKNGVDITSSVDFNHVEPPTF